MEITTFTQVRGHFLWLRPTRPNRALAKDRIRLLEQENEVLRGAAAYLSVEMSARAQARADIIGPCR